MQLHFDTLPQGLLVTLIGIMIVFLGLIVLIGLISVINWVTGGIGRKEKAASEKARAVRKAADPGINDDLLAVISSAVAAADQDEVIAVISAAVAMMEEGTTFRVRRIRRISNAPAWQKAGREEQVYSRY